MKRVFIISTAIILFISVFTSVAFATFDGIDLLYNNVNSATVNASVSNSGNLTVNMKYKGTSGVTTKGTITTYVEKKTLGLFWTRVNIGQINNQWVDTSNNYEYSVSHTYQLSDTGTYRVTAKFVITGTGGSADNITKQYTLTY